MPATDHPRHGDPERPASPAAVAGAVLAASRWVAFWPALAVAGAVFLAAAEAAREPAWGAALLLLAVAVLGGPVLGVRLGLPASERLLAFWQAHLSAEGLTRRLRLGPHGEWDLRGV